MFVLDPLLRRLVEKGTLSVIDPAGRTHRYGGGFPQATIRLHDWRLVWRLLLSPSLAAGEGYMDGRLTIEQGSLVDFLAIVCSSGRGDSTNPFLRGVTAISRVLRHVRQYNPAPRARRNVAHHYDLSDELYSLFLDRDKQYSCGYHPTGKEDLETAQELKKRHLAAKLLLRPGLRVLDIGSGWGGLALYLARETGADVTGITLSSEQLAVARRRALDADLDKRVRFELCDYRARTGPFDRIVSVGMFEHVGVPHYGEYFGKIAQLLNDDGVALVHTIGRASPPGSTEPWIAKYIFPGGYIPALSEMMRAVEKTGLFVTDVEVLRVHYAETLRAWRYRFQANREKVKAIYDERFCRMWEYYLTASEAAFRYLDNVVFQVQLAKRRDAVPLARDYITEYERTAAAPAHRHSA